MDNIFSRDIIRKEHKRSDIVFFAISLLVGVIAGVVTGEKISPTIGIPFAVFSACLLFFTWRNPSKQ